jgi:dTDP-4-dehydrorhamnose 3,5-epimerase
MHFSVGRGATKLVRCGRGAIHDVLVDVRRGSPTFGQWEGFDLTDENMHILYVPVGFAHGFCVLSDTADVLYKQDAYYSGPIDRAIKYDDPDVAIAWPLPTAELVPSQRDIDAPLLRDVADGLPFEYR